MNRIELLWSRTRAGPGAQAGERVLELARERGVPGADVRLHLLEGEVRIERDLVGAQRHRQLDSAVALRSCRSAAPPPSPTGAARWRTSRPQARSRAAVALPSA